MNLTKPPKHWNVIGCSRFVFFSKSSIDAAQFDWRKQKVYLRDQTYWFNGFPKWERYRLMLRCLCPNLGAQEELLPAQWFQSGSGKLRSPYSGLDLTVTRVKAASSKPQHPMHFALPTGYSHEGLGPRVWRNASVWIGRSWAEVAFTWVAVGLCLECSDHGFLLPGFPKWLHTRHVVNAVKLSTEPSRQQMACVLNIHMFSIMATADQTEAKMALSLAVISALPNSPVWATELLLPGLWRDEGGMGCSVVQIRIEQQCCSSINTVGWLSIATLEQKVCYWQDHHVWIKKWKTEIRKWMQPPHLRNDRLQYNTL